MIYSMAFFAIAAAVGWVLWWLEVGEVLDLHQRLTDMNYGRATSEEHIRLLMRECEKLHEMREVDTMILNEALKGVRPLPSLAQAKRTKREKEKKAMAKFGSKGKSPGAGVKKDSRTMKPSKSVAPVFAGTKLATQKGKASSKKLRG